MSEYVEHTFPHIDVTKTSWPVPSANKCQKCGSYNCMDYDNCPGYEVLRCEPCKKVRAQNAVRRFWEAKTLTKARPKQEVRQERESLVGELVAVLGPVMGTL